MKRIIGFMLILVLSLSLVGCGDKTEWIPAEGVQGYMVDKAYEQVSSMGYTGIHNMQASVNKTMDGAITSGSGSFNTDDGQIVTFEYEFDYSAEKNAVTETKSVVNITE